MTQRAWLLPLTPLYGAAVGLRELSLKRGWERVQRLDCPVISIGNLSTGGSGKTPLAIELARLLTEAGAAVDILSRGYGRTSQLPSRVNPGGNAEEFGDEPLLIAQSTGLPVYVAARRYEAGGLAEADTGPAENGRIHLLDDGFQHRQLHRDVDIVLVSRRDWNDSLLPAGNLREPKKAIRRADVVAIPVEEAEIENEIRKAGFARAIWRLKRAMQVEDALSIAGAGVGRPIAAFCGIAHPETFFQGLAAAGLQVASRNTFPDHHAYSPSDLQKIIHSARKAGAEILLTTEKDMARLGAQKQLLEAGLPLAPVRLRTEILDAEKAVSWIFEKLRGFLKG